jgi:hypothetical protein
MGPWRTGCMAPECKESKDALDLNRKLATANQSCSPHWLGPGAPTKLVEEHTLG